MKIKITGSSDDLIEIDGDIVEEWGAYNAGKQYIAVSDGTLLSIEYDNDGIWRITRIRIGSADYHKDEGSVDEDTFDVVTLTGKNIWWVALCKQYAGVEFGKGAG